MFLDSLGTPTFGLSVFPSKAVRSDAKPPLGESAISTPEA